VVIRGVKEAVLPFVPIFLVFIITHGIAIGHAIFSHLFDIRQVASSLSADFRATHSELGWMGMLILLMRAYGMGAGTYTGIEAVSNGIPILREPKVETAKRTMMYIAVSLSITVLGLMLAYNLYDVSPQPGKTLNAILFDQLVRGWPSRLDYGFVLITLVSEAALLFVAAQSGFFDGPRVLANMAKDRWVPTRFALLSDRLVVQNGILLIGGAALLLMFLTHGSVRLLVVFYSINVFITFSLSQLGMVRHWWTDKAAHGRFKKMLINGSGLALTLFILSCLVILKFNQGGWITLAITCGLISLVSFIKWEYGRTLLSLRRLDDLSPIVESSLTDHSSPCATAVGRRRCHAFSCSAVF
jgi:amino acid transporter